MFADLVFDENNNPLELAYVGGDAFYVIDDDGFHRHIDAEQVDRKVVAFFVEQLQGNQDMAVEQMMKMTGQDDLMAKAAMDAQIRNVNVDDIVGQILPQQARDMLGMMGFRIILNYRGEIVRLDQPSASLDDDDDY
jgi:hypothetical protein